MSSTVDRFTIEFEDDEDVHLSAGQFRVVPRGVEHRPVASEEAEILLFEPAETRNTATSRTTAR